MKAEACPAHPVKQIQAQVRGQTVDVIGLPARPGCFCSSDSRNCGITVIYMLPTVHTGDSSGRVPLRVLGSRPCRSWESRMLSV